MWRFRLAHLLSSRFGELLHVVDAILGGMFWLLLCLLCDAVGFTIVEIRRGDFAVDILTHRFEEALCACGQIRC